MSRIKQVLILPKLQIHNANALSSPYTIGFPAMTAWLGAVHALQRKINTHELFEGVKFIKTAVACHEIDLQTIKGHGDYEYSIIGTSNPLDKAGKRPSFIEEARCHLSVSLVIQVKNLDTDDIEEFIKLISTKLHSMKLASGDLLDFQQPEVFKILRDEEVKKLIRYLMPGYCLVERTDLMTNEMQQGKDAIDAILEYIQVTTSSEEGENGKVTWQGKRKTKAWIVPISVGFQGISELGHALNQRDSLTPHRFAESVVTLGEFIMAYKIDNIDQILWHYDFNPETNLYLCKQN